MSHLKKTMSLYRLNENQLKETKGKELSENGCRCGCIYANCGGSSSGSNFGANDKKSLMTPSDAHGC